MENPFEGAVPEPRKGPPCPVCRDNNSSPDYDKVDGGAIHPAIQAGGTPFVCWSCGHEWVGEWPENGACQ